MILNLPDKKKKLSLVPNDAYIRIFGFMRTALGLEKTELLVYALIYSYFRNCSSFTASREYIAEWVGSSKSAVDKALAGLVERGYITKKTAYQRGLRYVEYNINIDTLPPSSEHTRILEIYREDKRKCRDM